MKAFDPDKDTKESKRVVERVGHQMWQMAIKAPLEYMELADRVAMAFPNKAGDVLREKYLYTAQAQWSRTRGVYDFDPTLREALTSSSLEGLQESVFERLPELGVYIRVEAQVGEEWLHGGFVAWVPSASGGTLVVASITATGLAAEPYWYQSMGLPVYADSPRSFKERFKLAEQQKQELSEQLDGLMGLQHWAARFRSAEEHILILAAYLCTSEPDIRDPRDPKARPQRKKSNGPVRQWEVGYRFGAAFRKQLADAEQQAGTGHGGERNRPRVHVRRAHWHSFWTGPKDGERQRVVKWLPPVIVNGESTDLPTTIWRQK